MTGRAKPALLFSMIEPTAITNFNRTHSQLEEFWLFCILVAGKNSDFAASKLASFLKNRGEATPFDYIRRNLTHLHNMLVAHKVGQYTRIEMAIRQSLELDLEACSLDDLLDIYGVSNKTARFFLVHSRPNQKFVVLDTHILAWLRDHQVDAPKSTPSGNKTYKLLEQKALYLFEMNFGDLPLADIDLLIWTERSRRFDSDTKSAKFLGED